MSFEQITVLHLQLEFTLAYRVTAFGKKVFGREKLLAFFLNNSRSFWRLRAEISSELLGDWFHTHVRALSEDLLKKWIPERGSVIDKWLASTSAARLMPRDSTLRVA